MPKYLETMFNCVDTRDFVAIKRGDLYFGNSLARTNHLQNDLCVEVEVVGIVLE